MFNARLGFLVFLCAAASACPAPATTTTSGATASGFESRAAITIETLSPGRTWDVYVATDAPAPADATKATAVVRDGKIEINQKIRFETGSSVIRDESSAILSELVKVFTAHPDIAHVRIEGHTDTIGSAKSNQQLSEARASAVAKYLADNGVKAKLDTAGFGSTRILCSETDDECHRRNRRVEFFILGRKEETAKPAPSPKPAPVVAEASGATSLRPECRETRLGGAHFIVCDLKTTWRGALNSCKGVGDDYDLASIHSNDEQQAILKLATQSAKVSNTWYYTGLNDLAKEGSFAWTDGTSLEFSNWYQGEPNNDSGTEHCGQLYHDAWGMQWNDIPCNWTEGTYGVGAMSAGFVCRGGERPDVVDATQIVGTWAHRVDGGNPSNLFFSLDAGSTNRGSIESSHGDRGTWVLEGQTMTMSWPNSRAPGGFWVDTVVVSADFKSYEGRNNNGANGNRISGTRQ